MVRSDKNAVIIGAGPGGLCAAWNLIQDGYRVIVLEKEPVCGGQSITFERDGFRYDIGPHNIHSRHENVLAFLKRCLGEGFAEHEIYPQIYFRGKRVEYPLVGIQVLRSLPVRTSIACGLSFLLSHIKLFISSEFHDDGTYETWVVNRFGRRFYDIFFGPYSRKAWGVPPSELSDVVAKKRIAIRDLSELLSSILFKKEQYHPENPRFIRHFYPKRGVGEISDYFVKGIRESGGELHTSAEVTRIRVDHPRVVSVDYAEGGKSCTLDLRANGAWEILSTIPLNELMLKMDGDIPPSVTQAASGLDFTSEVFVYMNVNQPDVFGCPLVYFSEEEFPFNRVYDVGLFSRDMVPAGRNAICLEITCSHGDETWNAPDDELYERCLAPLEARGLLRRSQVEDHHVRRLQHAYPRFRVGYQERLRAIFDFLGSMDNLTTFGREGLFTYANVDDVIWMAFEIAQHLPYKERMPLSIEALLPQYVDF